MRLRVDAVMKALFAQVDVKRRKTRNRLWTNWVTHFLPIINEFVLALWIRNCENIYEDELWFFHLYELKIQYQEYLILRSKNGFQRGSKQINKQQFVSFEKKIILT